tara:strand:+ start:361 stop:1020 length:660 start_codon:yes stop_codon:yes gene_type:complete
MKKISVITVDGPSASGKGALSRGIANYFGFSILDSGILYRLYAYLWIKGFTSKDIAKEISRNVNFELNLEKLLIIHNSDDITNDLRTEFVGKSASEHSSKKEVRDTLFDIQRSFYNGSELVADGRDMGTVVFKKAKLKIFLTASPEIRAKRRYLELQNLGQEVNMLDLISDIEQRDFKDSTRELSPLLPAEDAHIIDTSNMSLEEVFIFTKNLIKKEFV